MMMFLRWKLYLRNYDVNLCEIGWCHNPYFGSTSWQGRIQGGRSPP